MGKRQWFRVFVEHLLMDEFSTSEVIRDADGDVPFHSGSSACFVTVEEEPELGVRVWGMAALGLRPTAAVLREVNDLNDKARLAKVVLADGGVCVELRLPADQVTAKSLSRACGQVVRCADDIGVLFAGIHGGSTPFASPARAS